MKSFLVLVGAVVAGSVAYGMLKGRVPGIN